MSRSGRDPGERLRNAGRRSASSARWLTRQLNDPYVRQARTAGYRSRAAYKLIELDERFALLGGVRRAVDLGIAPGGWSQVLRQRAPRAAIVGIDLLPTDPLEGVTIIEADFMDDAAPGRIAAALGGAPDLVLSDMAANTVGHRQTDHLRTMGLVEAAADFAIETLAPGGAFRRQGPRRRHRCSAAGDAQAPLRQRQARETAGEPQGFVRMVRDRAAVQARLNVRPASATGAPGSPKRCPPPCYRRVWARAAPREPLPVRR